MNMKEWEELLPASEGRNQFHARLVFASIFSVFFLSHLSTLKCLHRARQIQIPTPPGNHRSNPAKIAITNLPHFCLDDACETHMHGLNFPHILSRHCRLPLSPSDTDYQQMKPFRHCQHCSIGICVKIGVPHCPSLYFLHQSVCNCRFSPWNCQWKESI